MAIRRCRVEGTGSQQRAYSAEPAADFYTAPRDADFWAEETDPGRRPFLVALGVLMVLRLPASRRH